MAGEAYRNQVRLLVRVLPFIAEEECFALKGGTAINLFVRDLPRLSVDIDLTYLPVNDRETALNDIQEALRRIGNAITAGMPGTGIQEGTLAHEKTVNKLFVRNRQGIQVKIEVTPVLRGCVYDPEIKSVSGRVEAEYGFAETQLVSFADLYGGKIVAALDRQHPRDLFDIRDLLANEGIDDDLRRAFIVYLISHNRPMSEVLSPTRKNINDEFARGLASMTEDPVELESLLETREALIADIAGNMPDGHRAFLLSFERGEPEWDRLGLEQVRNFPAVRWRQQNLANLDREKRLALINALEQVLEGGAED